MTLSTFFMWVVLFVLVSAIALVGTLSEMLLAQMIFWAVWLITDSLEEHHR